MAGYMNKLRTEMAERFLDALNQGRLPWKACWQQSDPCNAVSEKPYRGVNAMMLSFVSDEMGYKDPRWCTYLQAKAQGWQVRKGEKSALVEYWAYYDKKEKKLLSWADARKLFREDKLYAEKYLELRSRCYNVFNAEQIDGIPEHKQSQTDIGKIREKRDRLLEHMAVSYREVVGSGAFYQPKTDTITLPPEASFNDTYGYMATFLHEAAHASGHESRLNRDLSGLFGSPEYAREELRAEIASAFTAQTLGLQLSDEQLEYQIQQHSAYVQSWASVLKEAPEELFQAIRTAEGISDYLIEQGEFLLEQESFFAKIVYGDELPVYYDDRQSYMQEVMYQNERGGINLATEMSREEFLADVSESLMTQGHYMSFGANLTGDYTEEIRAYMAAHPPQVSVHPWMAHENHMVDTVHRWEQTHLEDAPDQWSVKADGHTGQLLLCQNDRQLLEQRYRDICQQPQQEIRQPETQELPDEPEWEP